MLRKAITALIVRNNCLSLAQNGSDDYDDDDYDYEDGNPSYKVFVIPRVRTTLPSIRRRLTDDHFRRAYRMTYDRLEDLVALLSPVLEETRSNHVRRNAVNGPISDGLRVSIPGGFFRAWGFFFFAFFFLFSLAAAHQSSSPARSSSSDDDDFLACDFFDTADEASNAASSSDDDDDDFLAAGFIFVAASSSSSDDDDAIGAPLVAADSSARFGFMSSVTTPCVKKTIADKLCTLAWFCNS